ncbi:MAG TPA: hypothetical protein VN749_02915, partial [Candidatus Eisenbacteria bacterium]|nr:hypothetical protein [Candidatus Eisenbacteria bacterium]
MLAFVTSSQTPTVLERIRSKPDWRRAVTAKFVIATAIGSVLPLLPAVALGQSSYYRHTFFDNGPRDASYYYSAGKAVPPSTLETRGNRLPLDASTFFTAPNSVKVTWESKASGAWAAEISVLVFRNRDYHFDGDTLAFWVYSPEGIRAAAMPNLRLLDMARQFSKPVKIGDFSGDIAAKKWRLVRIPFGKLETGSIHPFDPRQLKTMIFEQGAADRVAHTLFVDEIRIENAKAGNSGGGKSATLAAPANLKLRAYERHIDLSWEYPEAASAYVWRWVIYRSTDGKEFQPIGIQTPGIRRYTDFLGKVGETRYYKVAASDVEYQESAATAAVSAATQAMSDDELLT